MSVYNILLNTAKIAELYANYFTKCYKSYFKKEFFEKKKITESKMRERKTELNLNDVSNLCVYNHCAVHWLICNFTLLKY